MLLPVFYERSTMLRGHHRGPCVQDGYTMRSDAWYALIVLLPDSGTVARILGDWNDFVL